MKSIQETYKEVYFSLLTKNSSGVMKDAVITKYMEEANVARPTAYRHFSSIKDLFTDTREWHEPSGRKRKFITLRVKAIKTDMDLELFKQKVMAMEGDDRLKAFVLETVRLYPENYTTIGKAANQRVKKLKIEKKIAHHQRKINALRRQLE